MKFVFFFFNLLLLILILSTTVTASPDAIQETTALPPFPTSTASFSVQELSQQNVNNLVPFPTSTASLTPPPPRFTAGKVYLTCFAEPKFGYATTVRQGPGTTWRMILSMDRFRPDFEMWVIGQNETGRWFQVVLPPPNHNEVGWVGYNHINLFGNCDELPMTDDVPELAIEDVRPASAPIGLPDFVSDINLTEYDRAFLIKPGILYVRREIPGRDEKDDLQAHILVLDLTAPQLEVQVEIGAIPDQARVKVSDIAANAGAFAAINGDFYGGNYMPQGLTIIDGEVVTAPKHRATFAITSDKQPYIGYFTDQWTWGSSVVAANGATIPLQLMNLPCEAVWLCLYSHHLNGRLPFSYGGVRVLLDSDFNVMDIVNQNVVDIPDGHFVLRGGDQTGDWLLNNIAIGDQIFVNKITTPDWTNFNMAISGGPRVLVDGEFWQDCDPTEENPICEEFSESFRTSHYFGSNIPRTAIGYSEDGKRLIAVMVEGYEVEDSRGMTQQELAATLLDFGAYEAMEFDGGGSSSMWIAPNGAVNDFGSDGERAISNALLFFWNE